jgi:hypothetical protein
MVNLVISGFGNESDDRISIIRKIEELLKGIEECFISVFKPMGHEIISHLAGSNKNEPFIMLYYEPKEIVSGKVEKIIKILEDGRIQLRLEYHQIPLAQATPNLANLKEAIAAGIM